MDFEIIDCTGRSWRLTFTDDDGKEGTLLLSGRVIGRFTEREAITYIEEAGGGLITSSTRVD